jgi:hypothetical protein
VCYSGAYRVPIGMLSKILPVTVQSWQTGAHLLHFHTEYPILSSLSSYRRIAGRSRNSIECPRPLLLSPVALSAVLPYGALLFSPNPPPPPPHRLQLSFRAQCHSPKVRLFRSPPIPRGCAGPRHAHFFPFTLQSCSCAARGSTRQGRTRAASGQP